MSQHNRATILTQALSLFAARGYDAVAVQEIVEAAGITKPTLYHYFGNKRGVLDALFQEYPRPLLSAVETAAEYQGDLPLNLTNLAEVIFGFAEANPIFYRLLLSTHHAPLESEAYQAAADVYTQMVEMVAVLFEKALPHMAGRHYRYAVTFLGMLDTYITLVFNDVTKFNAALIHDGVHQFMYGIYS